MSVWEHWEVKVSVLDLQLGRWSLLWINCFIVTWCLKNDRFNKCAIVNVGVINWTELVNYTTESTSELNEQLNWLKDHANWIDNQTHWTTLLSKATTESNDQSKSPTKLYICAGCHIYIIIYMWTQQVIWHTFQNSPHKNGNQCKMCFRIILLQKVTFFVGVCLKRPYHVFLCYLGSHTYSTVPSTQFYVHTCISYLHGTLMETWCICKWLRVLLKKN